jgi:hypothetical protein
MKYRPTICLAWLLLIFCTSCFSQELVRFEVVSGSGKDAVQTSRGEVNIGTDGVISSYKVYWQKNKGVKDYDFNIIKNENAYRIMENNSKEEMWEVRIDGDSVAILFKNNTIAQGSVKDDGFAIKYLDGANLLSLKSKGDDTELTIKKDSYNFKKNKNGLRRMFGSEDEVSVTENKLSNGDVLISELADYGLLSYKISGMIKPKSSLQKMINTVIFTRCFFDEVFPFILG